MKVIKNVLPQSKLSDFYQTMFESHLPYGNILWRSLSSTELQTLQCLQNRDISIIESARFKDLWPKKWLNVEKTNHLHQSVLVYKILNRVCPDSLWNMFQFRSSISNYNTRNDKDLHIPKVKLEFSKKGFQHAYIRAWNDIPNYTRELSSLSLKQPSKKTFDEQ